MIAQDVLAYVHHAISAALRDPVGRRDFALVADGAKVVNNLTSPSPLTGDNSPELALRDDLRIGQCWLVDQRSFQLGVGLPVFVHPTHVTVEHIPLEIAADIRQSPRKMLLWGMVEGPLNRARYRNLVANGVVLPAATYGRYGPHLSDDRLFVLLTSFEYNIHAPFHVQTFPIYDTILDLDFYFGVLVLEAVENWGAESTCLYRWRVHGREMLP
ncbi:hypothetical protein C8Q74DRAFT_1191173 [Fomes fomentarius]|nr:hypothetical protein C8Q74DRAFT_1207469 [Fomes fomentarius]KAI0800466.1 hypothetical protein C8Q74DRAFT_1191460 [Fomes fomentarius]KAI0801342.1 hypothetical protein C8Q74DRAFT_1191173 [Fomes fomentarius]